MYINELQKRILMTALNNFNLNDTVLHSLFHHDKGKDISNALTELRSMIKKPIEPHDTSARIVIDTQKDRDGTKEFACFIEIFDDLNDRMISTCQFETYEDKDTLEKRLLSVFRDPLIEFDSRSND